MSIGNNSLSAPSDTNNNNNFNITYNVPQYPIPFSPKGRLPNPRAKLSRRTKSKRSKVNNINSPRKTQKNYIINDIQAQIKSIEDNMCVNIKNSKDITLKHIITQYEIAMAPLEKEESIISQTLDTLFKLKVKENDQKYLDVYNKHFALQDTIKTVYDTYNTNQYEANALYERQCIEERTAKQPMLDELKRKLESTLELFNNNSNNSNNMNHEEFQRILFPPTQAQAREPSQLIPGVPEAGIPEPGVPEPGVPEPDALALALDAREQAHSSIESTQNWIGNITSSPGDLMSGKFPTPPKTSPIIRKRKRKSKKSLPIRAQHESRSKNRSKKKSKKSNKSNN